MYNIKNRITTVLLCLSALCAAGCSAVTSAKTNTVTAPAVTDTAVQTETPGERLSIVCTIFPEYDWVRQILGDKAENADIKYLLGSGTDLHSYQPTASDIMSISDCDMFIYVGGESDGWAEDALANAVNKDMKVINLMEVIGDAAKAEELKEGMQDDEHEHGDEDGDEHHHEEGEEHHHDEDEGHHHEEGEEELDEHVWLSLKNAQIFCGEITDRLCELDPANADAYRANFDAYSAQLTSLDNDIKMLVDGSSQKTLIFGDRFPFRYFVDDYGLDYYAAFIGCSAESEASFETIAFLSDKVNEIGADTVYIIENSDGKIARSVIDTSGAGCTVAVLDSAQSVTAEDIDNGRTYLGIMQSNYDALRADLAQ